MVVGGEGHVVVDDGGGTSSVEEASRQKLSDVAKSLLIPSLIPNPLLLSYSPCTSKEAEAYRCRCTFQIVTNEQGQFHYAVRESAKEPIIIEHSPLANNRIQKAMAGLLEVLNNGGGDENDDDDDDDASKFSTIGMNLSSISFASSWVDSKDCDIVVTMNYNQVIKDLKAWQDEALKLIRQLQLSQLTGRSKGRLTRTIESKPAILRDSIILRKRNSNLRWSVEIVDSTHSRGIDGLEDTARVVVSYEKPEGIFMHPNANVMSQALQWLLGRVSHIIQGDKDNHDSRRKPILLELYCGCGAHTMALWKSNMFSKVIALEIDDRLVQAFKRNLELNDIQLSEDSVTLIGGDAGVFASDVSRNRCSSPQEYDILLVDPPKSGLDNRVLQMALSGSFNNLFYISCGKDALVRDLQVLLEDTFEVVDCILLDLFPGTYSVESLVHLRRIKQDRGQEGTMV